MQLRSLTKAAMTKTASNDLILKELSKYLCLEDVKRLRIINWKWNYAFQAAYFQKTTAILESFQDIETYATETDKFIHSNFSIYFFGAIKSNSPEILKMSTFLSKYGNQINEFRWCLVAESSRDLWEIWKLLGHLPKMKLLEIRIRVGKVWIFEEPPEPEQLPLVCPSVTNFRIKFTSPTSDEEFFDQMDNMNLSSIANLVVNTFPNLEIMTIFDAYGWIDANRNFLTRFFALLGNTELLKRLEEIHFDANRSTSENFLRLQRKFKKLSIFFSEPLAPVEYQEFHDFLLQQGESLESLKMALIPAILGAQPPPPFPIPRRKSTVGIKFPNQMTKLKNLEICISIRKNMTLPEGWKNFKVHFPHPLKDFDVTFPSLESLRVGTSYHPLLLKQIYKNLLPDLDGKFTAICCNVKELKLDYEFQTCNIYVSNKDLEDLLTRFTVMFPSAYDRKVGIKGAKENWRLGNKKLYEKMIMDNKKLSQHWSLFGQDPEDPNPA